MDEERETEAMLRGQATIWNYMFPFVDSMALKCAVELGIPDIIHSHGKPVTLDQIAASIEDGSSSPTSPNMTSLMRVMRLLVDRGIFSAHQPSDIATGETLYGLTYASKWLVKDSDTNLGPLFIVQNHPILMDPWHQLGQCIRSGGIPFKMAHGVDVWEMASKDQRFNKMFNDGMACTNKIIMQAVNKSYKDGFASIKSLVDVGGGVGEAISMIVKANPHILGINFDLPQVVTTSPDYPGIEQVSGNMFESVPAADAVLMKWVLHDWGDDDCVKILKNCRKAIPENGGKLIIIESVLQHGEGDGLFKDTSYILDLVMLAHTSNGKERTEVEWKKLLADGGFRRYNIIQIPTHPSIIEAFPE